MTTYKVKPGDTLSKIARKFGVGLDAIVQLNGIRNADRIRVGAELIIPTLTTDEMDAEPAPAPPPDPPPAFPSVNRKKFALPVRQYIPEAVPKDLVVLHFTAGRTARSAFESWKQRPERVATAYIIERGGKIFELFDPAHWAFHLGVKGSRGRHDKRSIGVELANVGPLKPAPNNPDRLNWWPRDWGTRWCRRDEADKYVEAAHRGMDFFASFPDAQLDAAGALVRALCERFDIPKNIPASGRRMEFDAARFRNFTGVASHQNFRRDKWDVGPGFDWDRLGL